MPQGLFNIDHKYNSGCLTDLIDCFTWTDGDFDNWKLEYECVPINYRDEAGVATNYYHKANDILPVPVNKATGCEVFQNVVDTKANEYENKAFTNVWYQGGIITCEQGSVKTSLSGSDTCEKYGALNLNLDVTDPNKLNPLKGLLVNTDENQETCLTTSSIEQSGGYDCFSTSLPAFGVTPTGSLYNLFAKIYGTATLKIGTKIPKKCASTIPIIDGKECLNDSACQVSVTFEEISKPFQLKECNLTYNPGKPCYTDLDCNPAGVNVSQGDGGTMAYCTDRYIYSDTQLCDALQSGTVNCPSGGILVPEGGENFSNTGILASSKNITCSDGTKLTTKLIDPSPYCFAYYFPVSNTKTTANQTQTTTNSDATAKCVAESLASAYPGGYNKDGVAYPTKYSYSSNSNLDKSFDFVNHPPIVAATVPSGRFDGRRAM